MLIRSPIVRTIVPLKTGDVIRFRPDAHSEYQTFPIEMTGDAVIFKEFFARHPGTYFHETTLNGGFVSACVKVYSQNRELSNTL